jgi:apolipoprotein D and lipocalin family protein
MDTPKLLLFGSACVVLGAKLLSAARAEPPVVPHIDLERFQGVWYEIARLPNRFERDCERDVSASYRLKKNGTVEVINECSKPDGSRQRAKGTARLASKSGPNTKLKVSFFWPFSGDYWILSLDPEYRHVLVGTPDRKYLWILSRTPTLGTDIIRPLIVKAEHLGYDVGQLRLTRHS